MLIINSKYLKLWGKFEKNKRTALFVLIIPFHLSYAHAENAEKNQFHLLKDGIGQLFAPKPKRSAEKIDITELSRFPFDTSKVNELTPLSQVSYDVTDAIINIKRYQEISKIAQEQIKGIGRIAEIANLRAKAGISSQADPIQAQSNLEAAESNLIVQQMQLRLNQQRLRTLLGFDVSANQWEIPAVILQKSDLYKDSEYNFIPSIMQAQAGVEVAKFQKKQAKLSAYPTINIKGSLSQVVNGRNPNNNEDDGFYNSIMLEANSNFYQGGAIAAQTRAASYAEDAARAQVNTAYLDVLDRVRLIREQIENKKRQMSVLVQRRETTARTKELYQEQYKLGTRTVVDLLNAEQSIHSAAMEIVNSQYDIYSGLAQYMQVTGRSREIYELNNKMIQGVEVQP